MENIKESSKLAQLEALLFIHGEPIELTKLEKILDLVGGEGEVLVSRFAESLQEEGRGLRIIVDGEKVQLVTKPEFSRLLEDFIKEELSEDLTPASLEVLSIISYLGPISRSRLEYLRGVNSMFTIRSLMLRGLISRFQDPKRANAYLYKPSFDLIKHLGLGRAEDLPEFEKFNSLAKKFEMTQAAEPEAIILESKNSTTSTDES